MKKPIACAAIVALLTPTLANAADKKNVTGALLLLGGAGSMALAFDYHSQCPSGYTTHTFQNLPTQCVYVDRYGSDVIDQPTNINLSRKPMLWGGIGAVAAGVMVLAMPRRAARQMPSIEITPNGWRATKAFSF